MLDARAQALLYPRRVALSEPPTLVVALLHQLLTPLYQVAQRLALWRCAHLCGCLEDLRHPGQHAGVDRIGLGQLAQRNGKGACPSWIDPHNAQPSSAERTHDATLVPPGGLQYDPLHRFVGQKRNQLPMTRCRVRDLDARLLRQHPHSKRLFGNINPDPARHRQTPLKSEARNSGLAHACAIRVSARSTVRADQGETGVGTQATERSQDLEPHGRPRRALGT